jgi:hypothetical protein
MSIGTGLSEQLSAKVDELKQAVSSISEAQASRRPADGEWCAKEVLSHLTGPDGAGTIQRLSRFVDEDTPGLELQPGVSAFTPDREQATASDLMARLESQYSELVTFLTGLTDSQFSRQAHVAALKGSPLGDYPTLGQYAGFIVNVHIATHVNQVRALCQ